MIKQLTSNGSLTVNSCPINNCLLLTTNTDLEVMFTITMWININNCKHQYINIWLCDFTSYLSEPLPQAHGSLAGPPLCPPATTPLPQAAPGAVSTQQRLCYTPITFWSQFTMRNRTAASEPFSNLCVISPILYHWANLGCGSISTSQLIIAIYLLPEQDKELLGRGTTTQVKYRPK